jgi:hypothetical protein
MNGLPLQRPDGDRFRDPAAPLLWVALIDSTECADLEPWRFPSSSAVTDWKTLRSAKAHSGLFPWLACSLLSISNACKARSGRIRGQWVDVGARGLIDGTALAPEIPSRRPACECSLRHTACATARSRVTGLRSPERLSLYCARGEDLACAELERQGLQVLERNWRCRLGEIDLVAAELQQTARQLLPAQAQDDQDMVAGLPHPRTSVSVR